ncbi:MAG: flavin reductase family protein [Bacteroidales bacterium]|nr:flavin reductase family protein [Bacteroidales bacterium]
MIDLISRQWMLLTAGSPAYFNCMTASWGGLGHLWSQNVLFAFVRPQRFTYHFMENSALFTASFFHEEYRNILTYCGTRSGREADKIGETGLMPFELDGGGMGYQQAWLIMKCRKIYFQDIDPGKFLDKLIGRNYPEKDYHRMYIGRIEQSLVRIEPEQSLKES